MEQARIDIFLDEGWSLIDQLHRWLPSDPVDSKNRALLIGLIRDLQKLWSTADDLQLNRLARTILAIEQILERICAQSFVVSDERSQHVAAGIEGLQELLLGFEATREEPDFANLDALLRMEQATRETKTPDNLPSIVLIDSNVAATSLKSATEDLISSSTIVPATTSPFTVRSSQTTIDPSRVILLEQFTTNLEETCRGLLARIQTDEAPYMTTASRLEYLAQKTRVLAEQIVEEVRQLEAVPVERGSKIPLDSSVIDARTIAGQTSSIPSVSARAESLEVANDAPELPRLTSLPENSMSPVDANIVETKTESDRVLIVEESLFFRNLLGIAVQSAGYQPQLAESSVQGLEMLLRATQISAVLVGSKVSPALASAIEQFRRPMKFKVIGMTLPGHEKVPVPDLDARISKMHPQQLIVELDTLLKRSADRSRKSA